MSISLKLDIKLWRPNQQERRLTSEQIRTGFEQLKTDEHFLQALLINNFGCCLLIDGEEVSRCTCMYDGESSPDLVQLYEHHLLNLWQKKPVTIQFHEDMTAWNFIPENKDDMVWQILDTSHGQLHPTVEKEGRDLRAPFIGEALNWLQDAIEILKLYREPAIKKGVANVDTHIALVTHLFDYARQTLISHNWQPMAKTQNT